jgi:hypothetical protein
MRVRIQEKMEMNSGAVVAAALWESRGEKK